MKWDLIQFQRRVFAVLKTKVTAMVLRFQNFAVLILLAFATTISADQPVLKSVGFNSIEELFAAHVAAMEKQDHEAILRLGTANYQRTEVLELVYAALPSAAQTEDARAIFVRHGLDWNKLNAILNEWLKAVQAGQGVAELETQHLRKLDGMISANVDNPARLYADIVTFGEGYQLSDLKLENLELKGDIATARRSYRQIIKITHTSGSNAGTTFANEVSGSDGPVIFRRVDDKWFYGLTDESIVELSTMLDQPAVLPETR